MMRDSFHGSPRGPRPVAVDLFAGAGGLSLGLEQSGFEIGVAIERAPGPASTHRSNFPFTPMIAKDIMRVTASEVRTAVVKEMANSAVQWEGEITLCAGGPPCQGYSVGGHRRVDDERNALVHQFRRLVTKLESRYFLMENVPGMLLPANAPTLKKLIAAFERAGYEVAEPFVLDASRLGLPQSRRRVLIIGWRDGEKPVDTAALQDLKCPTVSVHDALNDLPEIESFEASIETETLVLRGDDGARSAYAEKMRSVATGFAQPRRWDGHSLSGCSRTKHSAEVVQRFRQTKPGDTEPISRYRRLAEDGIAPTLRAGTGPDHGSHTPPRPIHYRTPRVITVREAARLQSFPDWFQFATAKWHAWQEIGNAVPPLMARVLGGAVLNAAGILPNDPNPLNGDSSASVANPRPSSVSS